MHHTKELTCLELAKLENDYLGQAAADWNFEASLYSQMYQNVKNELHSRRLHVFYTILAVGLIGFIGGIFFTWVRLNMMCDKWYVATLGSPIKEIRCTYNV